MTLLIDPPNTSGHGTTWSHLASDESFEELHEFAGRLGVPNRGFDRDHYDIPASHYERVLAAGAVAVSSRELIARLHRAGLRRRKARMLGPKPVGNSLVRPARLRAGDTVAVVAPAGPVRADRLDAGLRVLEHWGLDVCVLPHARGRHESLAYLAGTDAERAGDLMRAWTDPSVSAVFCARGGYGTQRMVDLLDWAALAEAGPKVLVGFSDVTALHQAFAARLGMSSIHGPVVTSLGSGDEESRTHLRAMLFTPDDALDLAPVPMTTLVPGRAEGVLVGGNVALLASSVGTPDSRPAAGSLAVLEDVAEEPYRLDRLVTLLLRAGWFDDVRGIALGAFTDCGPPETVRSLLAERLAPLGVPMLAELGLGHGERNLAFPQGVRATLDADAGTLTLRDPALL